MRISLTISFLIVTISSFNAQHLTNDIGVFIGTNSLQTDYGKRGDFASNFKNRNSSFTVAHYLHFFNKNTLWNPNDAFINHIMLKTELQFINKIKLEHHGFWAEQQTPSGVKIRAMTGNVKITNVGMSLEYYLRPLKEFIYPYATTLFNPFVSVGIQYSIFENSLHSELGNWREDITVLPNKFGLENALDIGKGQSIIINIGFGTRYKLSKNIDIITQLNHRYFLSDSVDGLQANVPENQNNEWMVSMEFGVIYHLNFNSPLFK
ncbi:THC0290_0291 family protein [Polaribacter tangerinus]|uniref:THC0290_0291 family protein n=1 Tax=Polaribacter tangerinus TaxID=1920034 RepID=UPI000B4B437C|nr:hypothetical protein [Polaribacter tangerinus]